MMQLVVDMGDWRQFKSPPLTTKRRQQLAEADKLYVLDVESLLARRRAALSRIPRDRVLD